MLKDGDLFEKAKVVREAKQNQPKPINETLEEHYTTFREVQGMALRKLKNQTSKAAEEASFWANVLQQEYSEVDEAKNKLALASIRKGDLYRRAQEYREKPGKI